MSMDPESNVFLTALTRKTVLDITQLHLKSHSPGYDGRYDRVMGSASAGGKL